jgi:hypothetical protein
MLRQMAVVFTVLGLSGCYDSQLAELKKLNEDQAQALQDIQVKLDEVSKECQCDDSDSDETYLNDLEDLDSSLSWKAPASGDQLNPGNISLVDIHWGSGGSSGHMHSLTEVGIAVAESTGSSPPWKETWYITGDWLKFDPTRSGATHSYDGTYLHNHTSTPTHPASGTWNKKAVMEFGYATVPNPSVVTLPAAPASASRYLYEVYNASAPTDLRGALYRLVLANGTWVDHWVLFDDYDFVDSTVAARIMNRTTPSSGYELKDFISAYYSTTDCSVSDCLYAKIVYTWEDPT